MSKKPTIEVPKGATEKEVQRILEEAVSDGIPLMDAVITCGGIPSWLIGSYEITLTESKKASVKAELVPLAPPSRSSWGVPKGGRCE